MKEESSKLGNMFISYGQYHNNLINKLIHIIFVPLITISLVGLLNCIPVHYQISGVQLGLGDLMLFAVAVYYLLTSWLLGILMIIINLSIYYLCHLWFGHWTRQELVKPLLIVHIASWIMQFVGHGVFEKRKPALFDSASQIFSAPMFVFIEVLMMVGIGQKQWDDWHQKIGTRIKTWKLNSNKTQ